jgi:hypothetical protein
MLDLENRMGAVMAEGGPDLQTAALALVDQCAQYAHRPRHDDAESGPAAPLKQTPMLFLMACREYLGAEAEQCFGLRPTGRSLFARLSTR